MMVLPSFLRAHPSPPALALHWSIVKFHRFDPYIMETYLDDLREMKRQVYDLFKYNPELLTGPELSKGEPPHALSLLRLPSI